MSIDLVLKRIDEVTKKEKEKIIAEGEEKSEAIIASAQKEADRIKKEKEKELENTLQELKEVRLSKTRMEYKRKKLDMEKEVIQKLWERVMEKVSDIDSKTNKRLLKKLLHLARATPVFSIASLISVDRDILEVPTERPFYIYSNPKDEKLIRELSDLEYDGTIKCIGGFVAESEDRNWKINLTYDAILEEIFENSLKKVYYNLIGE